MSGASGEASVPVPASIPSAGLKQVLERAEMALEAFENFAAARAAMNAARPDVNATPAERALHDERYRHDHECERAHWTHALHIVVSGDLRKLVDAASTIEAQERAASAATQSQTPKD